MQKSKSWWRRIQMNKIERLVAYAVFLMPVLWAPASSFAQSPFDGLWRTNMNQAKISPTPIVFSVSQGLYECPRSVQESDSFESKVIYTARRGRTN
jgi:hypothetical protein